jgi:hypothetical protein
MQSVWALVSLIHGLIKAAPLLYKYTYFKRQLHECSSEVLCASVLVNYFVRAL